MNRQLAVLLACVFVVMVGFGITLPVLPFYIERLAVEGGASRPSVVLHVTALTAVYALMQFAFAPLWGRWSDRIGRRPLVIVGIAGYAIAQVLFSMSTSLWLLYLARIIGGTLSSAVLPVSAAYVVDSTTKGSRSRGLAWLGTVASLGVVLGPALGGLLSQRDWHLTWRNAHLRLDSFSTPFLAAALLALLALLAAWRWLPESKPGTVPQRAAPDTRSMVRGLAPLLALAMAGQFGLTIFEGTFALFAQVRFDFGPAEVGYVFMVCGLVMTVSQAGVVALCAGRISELVQVGLGFAVMGTGIAMLTVAQSRTMVFGLVALLSLGMAFIAPNLSSLVSRSGGSERAGTSLGFQTAAGSLGQAGGPLLGGMLFLWDGNAPYLFAGAVLMALALVIAWNAVTARSAKNVA